MPPQLAKYNAPGWSAYFNLGNVVTVFEDKDKDGELIQTTDPATNEVPHRYHYYSRRDLGASTEEPLARPNPAGEGGSRRDLGASTEEPLARPNPAEWGDSFGMQWDLGHTTVYIPPDYSDDNRYEYNGKEYETIAQLLDYGWRWYDPVIGRWGGVDPLASRFPSWSSYSYCFNNPIRFIDPDGRAPDDVIIKGHQAQKAVAELNASSSLTITRNAETGKLSSSGKARGKADKLLLKAINDKNITVELLTTSAQLYDSKDGTPNIPLLPGGFEGSNINDDGTVTATQLLNVENAEVISGVIGETTGETIRHEINEAYSGAVQNPGGDYNSAYKEAHSAASKVDGIAHPHLNVNRDRSRSPNVLQIRKEGTTEWKDLGPIKE